MTGDLYLGAGTYYECAHACGNIIRQRDALAGGWTRCVGCSPDGREVCRACRNRCPEAPQVVSPPPEPRRKQVAPGLDDPEMRRRWERALRVPLRRFLR